MRDFSARELKGHNILAVERFQDSTRWMIEFSVLRPCSYDPPQGEVRAIVATGFTAFLKLHNITWFFILCCALVICGVVIMLLNTRKKGT